jgi:hypothetical protein
MEAVATTVELARIEAQNSNADIGTRRGWLKTGRTTSLPPINTAFNMIVHGGSASPPGQAASRSQSAPDNSLLYSQRLLQARITKLLILTRFVS